MTKRTYSDAYKIARDYAMRGDRDGAVRVMSNLLWHVDAEDGGFVGLSDAQREAFCARDKRVSYDEMVKAAWAPMRWPESGTSEREAA